MTPEPPSFTSLRFVGDAALKLSSEPVGAATRGWGIPVIVEPRALLVIELSCRTPTGLAASALAAKAVYVFEAAGEHVGETPDLHVQRPGDSDIHSGTHVARRGSQRSWLRSWCFSYRWIGGSFGWFTSMPPSAAENESGPPCGRQERTRLGERPLT